MRLRGVGGWGVESTASVAVCLNAVSLCSAGSMSESRGNPRVSSAASYNSIQVPCRDLSTATASLRTHAHQEIRLPLTSEDGVAWDSPAIAPHSALLRY